MIGGKTNSATKPTALGTMLNAATYGATKPTIIGTTRSALLAIWAANLRQGGSGKKSKKKGAPTYVENVDFLIGSNPIEGVLQIWANNTNRYTMNFVKVRTGGVSFDATGAYQSFSDPHFYFITGVTAEVTFGGTFNDYGDPSSGAINAHSVSNQGGGYVVGDTFSVNGGSVPAIGIVLSVFGGQAQGVWFTDGGQGYSIGSNIPTTTLTGGGSGLTINISSLAKKSFYGTYEYPLWNSAQHGPDLVNAAGARWWPYVYYWKQAFGPKIYIPFYQDNMAPGNGIPNATGFINVYYMQLTKASAFIPPIQYNRMAFEQVLGSGTEYANAGLSAQQDLHPCDAGCGSSDIDLGSSGMLPDFRPEIKGSHALYSHGDADFADMIEDTMKSGQMQVLTQLGLIQRGLNCNDLPGVVQRSFYGQLEPTPTVHVPFYQPTPAGSVLIVFTRWRPSGGSNPTISDTAGNTYVPVMLGSNVGLWYVSPSLATAAAANVVSSVFNGLGFAYDVRHYLFEMDAGSNVINNTAVAQGTTSSPNQVVSCSITVTAPSFIFVGVETGGTGPLPPHWDDLTVGDSLGFQPIIMKRYVAVAGTYTFTLTITSSGTNYSIGMIAVSGQPSPFPKTLGDILDDASLNLTRMQCRANGLIGSITMNSQRPAADWLKEFYQCANAAPVWSGDVLKSIPMSEVSVAGNGVVYTSPTASGPVATLTINDLVADKNKSPVAIKRSAQVDANNVDQLEFCDRGNDYNTSVASQPESSEITFAGPRKLSPTLLHEIQDPTVARQILGVSVRRKTKLRNLYVFTAMQKWIGLEARDLIKIPDPNNFSAYIDVILTKVAENDNLELECEAEPFLYGVSAPDLDLTVTTVAPNNPDSGVVPALVNTPIFFEPPTAMTVNNAMQLWIPVSDSDPNYGGCFVYVSTDGGATYSATPIATVFGNAVTGVLTSNWPAGLDPDFVNNLAVDLTESLGQLLSYPVGDMNSFVHPFYVQGATTCGYELGAYSTATLTSAYHYTIPASPNGIRRDVYHQPPSGTVSHAAGKRFAFLGAASVASQSAFGDGSGIAKLAMQALWVGKTLFFKFQGFNTLGGGVQDLSTCVPYSYTPGGCAIVPTQNIVTIPVTSPSPGLFTVPHGLTYTPTFVTVQMTSTGDIQPQTPLGWDGTNVYLNATDVGLTALVTLWGAPADASVALSPSAPGNFSVPHGLASTPTLEIVQMSSSVPSPPMGDVWKQGTPYTSTNLNLVASDAGIVGKAYAWVTPPLTPTLARFVSIALAPGAAGNFSVAHGLGVVPKLVIVRMSSGGHIWLQSAPGGDATNLLLTASDAGITGEAEVWA